MSASFPWKKQQREMGSRPHELKILLDASFFKFLSFSLSLSCFSSFPDTHEGHWTVKQEKKHPAYKQTKAKALLTTKGEIHETQLYLCGAHYLYQIETLYVVGPIIWKGHHNFVLMTFIGWYIMHPFMQINKGPNGKILVGHYVNFSFNIKLYKIS